MKSTPYTVLIADDHAIVRDGLRMLLEAHSEFAVVAEAQDGRDAVRQAEETRPDAVVMDVAMRELNGIEATRMIIQACPHTQVVILSMYGTKEHIFRALKAGALGYVLKRSAGPELVRALQAVCQGERYLSREIADIVVDDYLASGNDNPARDALAELSQREREVLQLLAEGHANKVIANLIHLSPKTVHTYRSRIMQKLNLHDTAALIRFALQHTISPED
jgi:DNA-binding NarL/FixJ family response regulator